MYTMLYDCGSPVLCAADGSLRWFVSRQEALEAVQGRRLGPAVYHHPMLYEPVSFWNDSDDDSAGYATGVLVHDFWRSLRGLSRF